MKRLPFDTYTFKAIIEDGCEYVDKTDLVYKLAHDIKIAFLSRPRRFGKSMLCTTLKEYFLGNKELFKGLKIEQLETEWVKHPVFSFSMSSLKDVPLDKMADKLWVQLREYDLQYGADEKTETTPGARLYGLIKRSVAQTGQKAVVIIDEYDAPLLKHLNDPETLEKIRTFLQEFYQVIKDADADLRFAFLTGITKFSQLSIFSTLNNLKKITMMPEYEAICGITVEELHGEVLKPYVQRFADENEWTLEEAYDKLKERYDGYHFSKKKADIFNPFSLMNALADRELKNYWFDSGTSSFLIESLKKFGFDYTEMDNIAVPETVFDVPTGAMTNSIPLLFQSGYLTLKDYDKESQSYMLGIPNKEVRVGFTQSLLPIVADVDSFNSDSLVILFFNAIRDNDLDQALTAIQSYIASIPYDVMTKKDWEDKAKCEKFYQTIIYLMFNFFNRNIQTEVRSIKGRSDIVMYRPDVVYVLEIKVDKSADEALQQIEDKGYAIPYNDRANGRRVVKCGINISSAERTINEWKIVP